MKYRAIILLLTSCLLVISCDKQRVTSQQEATSQQVQPARSIVDTVHHDEEKDESIKLRQFADSLPPYYARIARFYFNKYDVDSCGTSTYHDSIWTECFRDIRRIHDLNGNGKYDSVIVLPPLAIATACEDGDSYYFLDTTLPRLLTDSWCCHPQNMFEVGDIDEDHIMEIGLFYSSCASRYKSLLVYSLKDGEWKEVGSCTIDILWEYNPDHRTYVRKTGRGRFEMLETYDPDKMDVKHWVKFKM